jgi:GTP cyclohydrolase I
VIEKLVEQLLKELGEDPHREGLERTPERVAKAMQYLTSGYAKNVDEILNDALFVEDYDEMVVVKDIDFASLCEHHLLPFIGKAHIAYLPRRRVVGISKLARLVDVYAKRLQIQEKMTAEIASCLDKVLKPMGVAVVIEATHQCMTTRGVHKTGVSMVTSRMIGVFRDQPETRQEFLASLRLRQGLPS